MSQSSDIEWTDATWNPVRGCTKVSPGCKHCYAETFAERFRGVAGHPYEQGFDPRMVPDQLDAPLHWRKPRTIFVNSMSDLFGEFVTDEYIAAVFGVMAATPRHTYQALTKRAARVPQWFERIMNEAITLRTAPSTSIERRMLSTLIGFAAMTLTVEKSGDLDRLVAGATWPLPNVHLGVSVEDRKYGLPRIEHLRRVPAAVRFLSIEPLLEDLGEIDLRGIHWVIVGGESGPGARPMHPAWVRRIREQCVAQRVPFFFKQWGAWGPVEAHPRAHYVTSSGLSIPVGAGMGGGVDRAIMAPLGKKNAGRLLDGRTWDEMPAGAAVSSAQRFRQRAVAPPGRRRGTPSRRSLPVVTS